MSIAPYPPSALHVQDGPFALVTFDRDAAPLVSSWVQDAHELFWLAPKTPPPLTAEKVIDWPGPDGAAVLLYREGGFEPIGYAELNPMPGPGVPTLDRTLRGSPRPARRGNRPAAPGNAAARRLREPVRFVGEPGRFPGQHPGHPAAIGPRASCTSREQTQVHAHDRTTSLHAGNANPADTIREQPAIRSFLNRDTRRLFDAQDSARQGA